MTNGNARLLVSRNRREGWLSVWSHTKNTYRKEMRTHSRVLSRRYQNQEIAKWLSSVAPTLEGNIQFSMHKGSW